MLLRDFGAYGRRSPCFDFGVLKFWSKEESDEWPIGLALYGRLNRKSVGSPGAVPFPVKIGASHERHRQ
eukprot:3005659-Pleurochrysis_carterae.AAC.1